MNTKAAAVPMSADYREKLRLLIIDRVVIGLFLVIIGFFVNKQLDSIRSSTAAHIDRVKEHRAVIARQLDELYLPLMMHIQFDSAIWDHRDSYRSPENTADYAGAVREKVVLPNHEEALALIMKNSGLIQNIYESRDDPTVTRFRKDVLAYERHVAIYKALVAIGSQADPVSKNAPYANDLQAATEARIRSLESQYSTVEKDTP